MFTHNVQCISSRTQRYKYKQFCFWKRQLNDPETKKKKQIMNKPVYNMN